MRNVVSLQVRKLKEPDYCMRINHCLPSDVRVLAYSFVPDTFNARFSCVYREYKYFFFKNQMDIDKIKLAAQLLIGTHDFRNFCKREKIQ